MHTCSPGRRRNHATTEANLATGPWLCTAFECGLVNDAAAELCRNAKCQRKREKVGVPVEQPRTSQPRRSPGASSSSSTSPPPSQPPPMPALPAEMPDETGRWSRSERRGDVLFGGENNDADEWGEAGSGAHGAEELEELRLQDHLEHLEELLSPDEMGELWAASTTTKASVTAPEARAAPSSSARAAATESSSSSSLSSSSSDPGTTTIENVPRPPALVVRTEQYACRSNR